MARPITWQDVSRPAGSAALVETILRSGRQIGEGITSIGNVAGQIRNDIQGAATGAAVAALANSDNPDAQLAATPQTWQFDPLAISQAANQRGAQLRTQTVQDAQLESTRLSTDLSRRTLQDREDEQLVASKFAPISDGAYGGKSLKALGVDMNDPWLKTKAGGLFLDRYNAAFREGQDDRRANASLAFQQAAAARAARQDREEKNLQNALGELVRRGMSAGVLASDPAQTNPLIADVFKAFDVPLTRLGDGQKALQLGLSGNTASEAQLDVVNPKTGLAPRTLLELNNQQIAAVDARLNRDLSQYDTSLRVGQLMQNNPYENLSDDEAAQMIRKRTGAGEGLAKDFGGNDVKERANAIQAYAKDQGYELKREQALLLVEGTIGEVTPWDSVRRGPFSILNDQVRADAKAMGELNRNGGLPKVQADIDTFKAAAEKEKSKLATQGRVIIASAIDSSIDQPQRLVREFRQTKAAAEAVENQKQRDADALKANLAMAQQRLEQVRAQILNGQGNNGDIIKAMNDVEQAKGALKRLK